MMLMIQTGYMVYRALFRGRARLDLRRFGSRSSILAFVFVLLSVFCPAPSYSQGMTYEQGEDILAYLAGIDGDTSNVSFRIDYIWSDVAAIEGYAYSMDIDLGTVASKVTTMDVDTGAIVVDVAAIETLLTNAALGGIGTNVAAIKSAVQGAQTDLGYIRTDTANLEASVTDTLLPAVSVIDSVLDVIATKITSLESGMVSGLGNVKTAITDIKGFVGLIRVDVGDIESALNTLNSWISSYSATEATSLAVKASVDSLVGYVDGIETGLAEIEADVEGVGVALGYIRTATEGMQADTAAIRLDVATLAALAPTFEQLGIDIGAVASNVYDLKNDLADWMPDIISLLGGAGSTPPSWHDAQYDEFTMPAFYEPGETAFSAEVPLAMGDVDVLTGWALPTGTDDLTAPVWSLSFPFADHFFGTELYGHMPESMSLTVDWAFFAPFRPLLHAVWLFWWGVWGARAVFEEVRRQ